MGGAGSSSSYPLDRPIQTWTDSSFGDALGRDGVEIPHLKCLPPPPSDDLASARLR